MVQAAPQLRNAAGPQGDLTDVMFSVRGVTNGSGVLHTRLDYTPYGVAMRSPAVDVTGDGLVDVFDLNAFMTVYNGGPGGTSLKPGDTGYDPDADLSGSGDPGFFDFLAFQAMYGVYGPGGTAPAFNDGWIDNPADENGPDNSVGYDGYWFDLAGATEATSTGLYMVRHRVYDPGLGRWVQRDPVGYADGFNLYLTSSSSPLMLADPLGLAPIPGNSSTIELDIPLGNTPCSAFLAITLHDKDECGCREFDLTVGLNCSVKETIKKRLRIKAVDKINFDISAYLAGQASGRWCDDCVDLCIVRIVGGFQVGNGRRGGSGPGRHRDPTIGFGVNGEGAGFVNLCTGEYGAEGTYSASLNLNIKLPFRNPFSTRPGEFSYNFDLEGSWSASGINPSLKRFEACS